MFRTFCGTAVKTEQDRTAVYVLWGMIGAGLIAWASADLGLLKIKNVKVDVPGPTMTFAEREALVAPLRPHPINWLLGRGLWLTDSQPK